MRNTMLRYTPKRITGVLNLKKIQGSMPPDPLHRLAQTQFQPSYTPGTYGIWEVGRLKQDVQVLSRVPTIDIIYSFRYQYPRSPITTSNKFSLQRCFHCTCTTFFQWPIFQITEYSIIEMITVHRGVLRQNLHLATSLPDLPLLVYS